MSSREIIARRHTGEPRDDLLGTLLSARDDDGSAMSDAQLRDEVLTLFLAGHETTSLALSHTLYLLSKHPAIERQVHDEVTSVLHGRLPTAGDVRALTFTDWVLKETMRLYPPAWATGRQNTEPFELRGQTVPVGTQLIASQWVVHRDARWFPNPEGFDPTRWAPERAKDVPRYAYFPFGGGPRVCDRQPLRDDGGDAAPGAHRTALPGRAPRGGAALPETRGDAETARARAPGADGGARRGARDGRSSGRLGDWPFHPLRALTPRPCERSARPPGPSVAPSVTTGSGGVDAMVIFSRGAPRAP